MNREYLVSVFFIPSLPFKALRTLVELGIRYSIYQFTHCSTCQTGDYNITIFCVVSTSSTSFKKYNDMLTLSMRQVTFCCCFFGERMKI